MTTSSTAVASPEKAGLLAVIDDHWTRMLTLVGSARCEAERLERELVPGSWVATGEVTRCTRCGEVVDLDGQCTALGEPVVIDIVTYPFARPRRITCGSPSPRPRSSAAWVRA